MPNITINIGRLPEESQLSDTLRRVPPSGRMGESPSPPVDAPPVIPRSPIGEVLTRLTGGIQKKVPNIPGASASLIQRLFLKGILDRLAEG